ncbi:MAG: SusC/RagA family TonB-linked outer membrane protein [Gemmatimonadetes bacterium]|nr:SusC/RagA family TonB-linked outer membrane protein [Gemmatimonadota bacterium]
MFSRLVRCFLWALAVTLLRAGVGWAQAGQISGVIVEERTQTPLGNVPVAVEGSQIFARTDNAGRFSLTGLTGPNVTLRVTWIGYRPETQVVPVGTRDLRIALTETAIQLDEIVVTGTAGVQRTRAIGNSVASLRVGDMTQQAGLTGLQDLVRGRIAGLELGRSQGTIGTGGVTRIRGTSSLSLSGAPLIYVDGVRLDNNDGAGPSIRNGRQVARINDIAPEEIERIEVIKGPAAATLYGTEASAGVIQIITKKGVVGKPTLDLSIRQGANWFSNPEGRLNHVYSRDASGNVLELDLLKQESDAGRPIFQTGRLQGYDAAFRGGSDLLRYFAAASWDDDVGIVSYNWLKRLNSRLNLTVTPSDKVDVSANMGFVHSRTRFAQAATGFGIIDQINWGSPSRLNTPTRGFLRVTPEAAGEIESYADLNRFTGSLQLKHSPLRWFNHRLTAGGDIGEEINSILFRRNPLGAQYFFGAQSLGEITREQRRVSYTTFDYAATGTFDLTSSLNSATSLGAQYYAKQTEELSAVGRQFPSPSVTTVGGAAITTAGEDFLQNKTLGLFGQQQFSWKNRLFVTAALRGDDNSAFGANFDFVTYPKFSASWVLNEEPFFKVGLFNTLKLRAAWGRAGQQPDVFAAVRLYAPTTGPGDQATVSPSTLGNPDLRPEVGEELELGFDAGLLKDRVGIEFTYYDKTTRDAIVSRTVAPSVGFPGAQFVNLGRIDGAGLELNLRGQLLTGSSVALELGGILAKNENKIVDLGGIPPSAGTRQNREGFPIRSYFTQLVLSSSLDATGRVVNAMCDQGDASRRPNGVAVPCAGAQPVYWGHPDPDWSGSASATLTLWQRLRLFGLLDFKTGHMIDVGDVGASHTSFRNSKAINEATDPILLAYDQTGYRFGAEFAKGGFLKLREISLAYTLPDRWAHLFRAQRGSVSLAARNVATLWVAQGDIFGTKIHDPEVYIGPTQTMLPLLMSVVGTVRLTF